MPQLKERESDQRSPEVYEQRVFTRARDREAEQEGEAGIVRGRESRMEACLGDFPHAHCMSLSF